MVKICDAEKAKKSGVLKPDMKITMLQANEKLNSGEVVKSNKRFQDICAKWLADPHRQPKRFHWTTVGVSPFNRRGAPPNMPYIHLNLCPGIETEGFEPSRARAGYVVKRTDPKKIQALVEHNQSLRMGSSLFPQMQADKMVIECLGGNHLTIGMGMFDTNMTSPMSGKQFQVPDDDPDLAFYVREGHCYHELKDGIPDEDCVFLSDYLNADQNQNAADSEMQLVADVSRTVQEIMKAKKGDDKHVKVGEVITKVTSNNLVRLRPDHVGDVAHLCIGFGDGPFISEIVWRHSQRVNPKDLTVSTKWMGDMSRAFPKDVSLLKLAVMMVQYDGDEVVPQTRPLPDVSRAIGIPEMTSLAKDAEKCKEIHDLMAANRILFEAKFISLVGKQKAMTLFHEFETNLARLALSKSLHVEFKHGVSGKYSKEKAELLQKQWVRDKEATSLVLKGVSASVGFKLNDDEDGTAATSVGDEVYIPCQHT